VKVTEEEDGEVEIEEWLPCECHSCRLQLYAHSSMQGRVEIAFWTVGHNGHGYSLWDKLRLLWRILTKGHAYSDMVILSPEEITHLLEFLLEAEERFTKP